MSVPEWLAPFSPAFQEAILPWLDRPGRRLACFDADGTLWSEDIGEAFFRWLAAGGLLPSRPGPWEETWAEYEARVHEDRTAGYTWAVQCMAGLAEADIRRWCGQMAAAWPNVRVEMTGLVRGLQGAGVETWIVSASCGWIVEAAAASAGFAPDRVIGIRTEVREGRITDVPVEPVSCAMGKVQAIRRWIGGEAHLAVGDSLGDLEMLAHAAQPLVVGRNDRPDGALVVEAARRGWPVHRF